MLAPARFVKPRLITLSMPLLLATLVACGSPPAREQTVNEAALEALPMLTVSDGQTLCTGGTPADTVCPIHVAIGNWLAPDRFAIWETGRPVQIWSGGKHSILLSNDTAATSHYVAATAVGPGKGQDEVVVLDAVQGVAHLFRLDGTHLSSKTLSPMTQLSIWGFYARVPVWQIMQTSNDHLSADVVIRVGKELGDTTAREAFRANLLWLHLIDDHITRAPPLFPNSILYAFADNGDVLWSDGTAFAIERDRPGGKAVWKLTSDVVGPAVDSADIANKSAELRSNSGGLTLDPGMVDSMATATAGTRHPALNGIVLSPSGQILAARTVLPRRDSVEYVRLGGDGVPNARFTLPKNDQMVLFAGDSLLVHRTSGDQVALLWLKLKPGK